MSFVRDVIIKRFIPINSGQLRLAISAIAMTVQRIHAEWGLTASILSYFTTFRLTKLCLRPYSPLAFLDIAPVVLNLENCLINRKTGLEHFPRLHFHWNIPAIQFRPSSAFYHSINDRGGQIAQSNISSASCLVQGKFDTFRLDVCVGSVSS